MDILLLFTNYMISRAHVAVSMSSVIFPFRLQVFVVCKNEWGLSMDSNEQFEGKLVFLYLHKARGWMASSGKIFLRRGSRAVRINKMARPLDAFVDLFQN